MFSLVNKHEEFFDFLVTNAEYFHKGALMAQELMHDISKLDRYSKDMRELEHAADRVTHEITAKMKQVFITPIDREDFYLLTSKIDDCVDDMKDVVFSLKIYHAGLAGEAPNRMADILVEVSGELVVIFRLMKDLVKNEKEITERAQRINALESEADQVYRDMISDLFDGSHELFDIIRWKEIMETLETTVDQAEDVANIVKEVVVKYA